MDWQSYVYPIGHATSFHYQSQKLYSLYLLKSDVSGFKREKSAVLVKLNNEHANQDFTHTEYMGFNFKHDQVRPISYCHSNIESISIFPELYFFKGNKVQEEKFQFSLKNCGHSQAVLLIGFRLLSPIFGSDTCSSSC